MNRPRLTKAPAFGPIGKAVNQLNRAVSNQANIRPGDGLGISVGPAGRMISLNSPVFMYAKSTGDGVPAAEDMDDGGRKFGAGEAYPASLKLVDGDYILYADDANPVEVLNESLADVAPDSWLILAKILNVWKVVWEDSGGLARAKCTTAIPTGTFDSPSGSGEAQIYRKDSAGDWVASGDPVQVWCQHAMDTSVPVDGTIHIAKIGGDWWLITRDC